MGANEQQRRPIMSDKPKNATNPDAAPPEAKGAKPTARRRRHPAWPEDPESCVILAEGFIKEGLPLMAVDVVGWARKLAPQHRRLRQLQGLALVRIGATAMANGVLRLLHADGADDEETLGLLARTHKDLGVQATDPEQRARELCAARDLYERAYRGTGGHWTGINAATLSLLLGETERARTLAGEVTQRCTAGLATLPQSDPDVYWLLATLGEAALVRGGNAQALEWYQRAVAASNGRWGDVGSTRRQARLILQHLGAGGEAIEQCLRLPCVVLFAGHMMDRADRPSPRFPAGAETAVKAAIRDRLREMHAGFGYSSAACGSDMLFQEAVQELGGETHVVLPYQDELFIEDSVLMDGDSSWVDRFLAVKQAAAQHLVASPHRLTWGGVTYEYANLLLMGRAAMHADLLQTDLRLLAVWDGREGDGRGGTATMVSRWRKLGHAVEIIDIREIVASNRAIVMRTAPGIVAASPSTSAPAAPGAVPEVKAMLFADLVHFGRLSEEQIMTFCGTVLGDIARLAARPDIAPRVSHTWGDALFCVFDTVQQAGGYALALQELMKSSGAVWAGLGLPPDLAMRTALHAGPVFPWQDPVTGGITYIGAHVNLASRIEPVTPRGEVYATWSFAALARVENATGFTCDYAGEIDCEKLDGPMATYRVRRT